MRISRVINYKDNSIVINSKSVINVNNTINNSNNLNNNTGTDFSNYRTIDFSNYRTDRFSNIFHIDIDDLSSCVIDNFGHIVYCKD